MTERPLIFSGPMVRAILAGKKTVTRRIVGKLPRAPMHLGSWEPGHVGGPGVRTSRGAPAPLHACLSHTRTGATVASPWAVGDSLWVRETHRVVAWDENGEAVVEYRADGARRPTRILTERYDEWLIAHCNRLTKAGWISNDEGIMFHPKGHEPPWRPSIYCERWASRIELVITNVRVERLQDITEADAIAEGALEHAREVGAEIGQTWTGNVREAFANLWESINAERASWHSNPWCWCLDFVRAKSAGRTA